MFFFVGLLVVSRVGSWLGLIYPLPVFFAFRFFTAKTREVREGLQQQQAQLNDVLAQQEQRLHAATQKLARVQAEVSRAEMKRATERGANQQAQSLRQQGLEKQLQAKAERVNRLEKNNHVRL